MLTQLADWLEHIDGVHPQEVEMGLERVSKVAADMALLPLAARSVIVAGTNGKGSTCVAIEAVLRQLGWRVGTTLSPHVSHFNERVRIDAVPCSDAVLCAGFASIEAARGDTVLTYFEFSALLALHCFQSAGVDVAVLEVGLGGRLDAFNMVDADVAVITSIGLDHTDYLGADVEQIGAEKAGVLRHAQQVVLGSPVTRSVMDRAALLGCDVRQIGRDFFALADTDVDHWHYLGGACDVRRLPKRGLAAQNCALGIQAALLLHARLGAADAESANIASIVTLAMAEVELSGRMERISVGERDFFLDVAHNPAAARFLAVEIAQRYPGRRVTAMFGGLRDKDSAGVVDGLRAVVERWVGVDVPGPRGLSAAELRQRVPEDVDYTAAGAPADALAWVHSATAPGDVIVVCGSFALVDSIRSALQQS